MNIQNFAAFSRPFIDSLKNIFETMLGTTLTEGKPSIKEDKKSKGDVTSSMGMGGTLNRDGAEIPFQGLLCLSLSKETYIKISNKMLGSEYTDIHDDIKDVGNEINNMMMGNAKSVLNDQGYKIEMSIPSIIFGKDHEINYPKDTVIVLIPMKTEFGDLYVEICYQD